jgi:hypothetical protein
MSTNTATNSLFSKRIEAIINSVMDLVFATDYGALVFIVVVAGVMSGAVYGLIRLDLHSNQREQIAGQRRLDHKQEAIATAFRGVPVRVFGTPDDAPTVRLSSADDAPENMFGVQRILGTTDRCPIAGGGLLTLLPASSDRSAIFQYQPVENTSTSDSLPAACHKPFLFQVKATAYYAYASVTQLMGCCELIYYFNPGLDNLKAFADYDKKLRLEAQSEHQSLTALHQSEPAAQ